LKHWKAEAARLQEELDNHNGGRSTCVILWLREFNRVGKVCIIAVNDHRISYHISSLW
jgi:hypothetical protein